MSIVSDDGNFCFFTLVFSVYMFVLNGDDPLLFIQGLEISQNGRPPEIFPFFCVLRFLFSDLYDFRPAPRVRGIASINIHVE